MKDNVKYTDIQRFDKLYHQFLRQNMTQNPDVPDELKDLAAIDISVINIISSDPDVIVREIANILNVPNSTLTSTLNRLEEKEIAYRIISPRDRRSFGVRLTEKGKRIQQVHLEFEQAYFERILAKLDTDDERGMLLDLLEKIINNSESE